MAAFPRYAIYYVAAPGSALDRFGASLLGYDVHTGDDLPFPDGVTQAIPDWRELTTDPRKYGFHATLKAPMALADGKTEAQLAAACQSFARTPRSLAVINPIVDSISGFVAVIPAKPSAALNELAADCTRALDCFRAPLTAEDRARRNPAQLSPRQREYLDRWGYPYVMEEFRFHMTLTGRLAPDRRAGIVTMLRDRFASTDLQNLTIDRIGLLRQDGPQSRFRGVQHYPLRAADGAETVAAK